MSRQSVWWDVAAGAAAGTAATASMSLVMYAAQQAGLVDKQPPAHVTETALQAAELPPASEPARRTADTIGHLAFGGVLGGLYSLTRRLVPGDPRAVPSGIAWGLLVWLASYAGWIPAVGILPAPPADRPGRQVTLLAGHVTYGATLGALVGRRPTF